MAQVIIAVEPGNAELVILTLRRESTRELELVMAHQETLRLLDEHPLQDPDRAVTESLRLTTDMERHRDRSARLWLVAQDIERAWGPVNTMDATH